MTFEILTKSGRMFRFEDKKYSWQYVLIQNNMEELDTSRIEILETFSNGEFKTVLEIENIVAVGEVEAMTSLTWPVMKRTTECPKCGFHEVE